MGCIGCGVCSSLCPVFWQMSQDNKSSLKDSNEVKPGYYELEVSPEDVECNRNAADSCPVNVISVE
ncbi:MAG: ferredoxin [Candidatus Altiarchaeales archaeon]|nr:ferredoxin [Candidatus Altiarchaeales archaeon]